MAITQRVREIEESATLAIAARARELKRSGVDVVSFSAGEPDFDTPTLIKEAAQKAIDRGETKYTATSGILELKEAICRHFREKKNVDYLPQEIIVSCGAKHSLYNAIMTLCEPGDEVLLPRPFWVTYLEQIKLAGGKPVILDCHPEALTVSAETIEKAITDRTTLLVLNNPVNPSGVVWPEKELLRILDLAIRHEFTVISDEIYDSLTYDGVEVACFAALNPEARQRTVVVNGVSKAYAMTGWRIGYAAGPREVIQAMGRLQDHMTSNPTSISQFAALAALNCPDSIVKDMVTAFDRRRKLMISYLSRLPDVRFPLPQGAFYVFTDFSSYLALQGASGPIGNSQRLTEILLEQAEIACVPGSAFGMEGYLRFSYATSEENIHKGMERLTKFLRNLT
ncbi:MAG TPA: pyridoxal phosphate-dependent aminotransferase [Atribacteraceae bacterium]|nr:pyridoxal phosphate-dependent aminotransferase [Atribacteraceae bacterium]